MLLGDIKHFHHIMTDTDEIKLILSNDCDVEIRYSDIVYEDTDSILIIRSNDDRISVNRDFIVFATFKRG